MKWLMSRLIVSVLALGAAPTLATPVEVGCSILTCANGQVLCEDVFSTMEQPPEGGGGGIPGQNCSPSFETRPCAEVPQCPKGTPAFGGAGLALLAVGLVGAGAFATKRRKRS